MMQQTKPSRGSAINPLINQELLESAPNAAAKGQAQYFTPVLWAEILGWGLPRHRPVIVDLTCGNGQLLKGVGGPDAIRLGCDIDPVGRDSVEPKYFVAADLCRFQSLLRQVDFKADLFVLNPPWDLHWHRDRLKHLAQSGCRAVVEAFAAHDGRTSRDTIDSTIVTLCLALDLCATYGEGMLIANEATLQRLIFAPGAPHRALVNHIWAHMVIDGNICTKPKQSAAGILPADQTFRTGVIWFARAPQSGSPKHVAITGTGEETFARAKAAMLQLKRERLVHRRGPSAFDGLTTDDTADLWQAAADEWHTITGARKAPQWNIMLDANGVIITDLSLFDQYSGRIPKAELSRLFALNGKRPMQLVIQKAHRKELERAAFGDNGDGNTPWKVAPAVQQAVRLAIKEYDAVRAPLRPLNDIQRLGYLDEQDEIKCQRDLIGAGGTFIAGNRYRIRTLTISVSRSGTKMNNSGELDDVEWTGSELCIYLKDEHGVERTFMEARLRNEDVTLSLPDNGGPDAVSDEEGQVKIDNTLQQLIEHFIIPEVPDVATLNPEIYQRNVDMLHEIESLIA